MRQKFIDEAKKTREEHVAHADAERRCRRLRAIAEKIDLFGPDCLSREGQDLVDRHESYFKRREKNGGVWYSHKTKHGWCHGEAERKPVRG